MASESIKAYSSASKEKDRMIEIKTMMATTLDEYTAIFFCQ